MEDGLEVMDTCLGPLESKTSLDEISQETRRGSSSELNALSSVVVGGVYQPSMVLKFIGGIEIGDGLDGSGDWGLNSPSG